MERAALEALGREELVVEARRQGVKRPEVMTRVELVDEVLRLGTPNPVERRQVRGWLGVARDLIADAVERGLNLPDAAAMIRGDVRFVPLHPDQPPVATVTLAEIYGAQGHLDRALGMLDEVLSREPDHDVARRLRARLAADREARRAKQREKEQTEGEPDAPTLPPKAAAGAEDEPDAPTLPPVHEPEPSDDASVAEADAPAPESTNEPDAPTLPPVAAQAADEDPLTQSLGRSITGPREEEEPDRATLSPVRAEPGAIEEEEPDRATLSPVRYDLASVARATTLEVVTPEHADVAALGYDEPGVETLVPAVHDAPAARSEDAQAAPSIDVEATTEPVFEAAEPAVVFARTGAGTASVYFEIGPLLRGPAPVLVLRVVEHRSRPDGVERVERDLPVTLARGTTTVGDLERDSVLRAALGHKWDGEFRAAAVGAEVRVTEGAIDVAWAPRRDVNYALVAGRSGFASTPAS